MSLATTFNVIPDNSTDPNFRAWGSAISAKLAACGLVQTADTGQINWTTVTKPTVGTAAGYEIWRFNDSLQATLPVYFKLEYGASSGNQTFPGFWLTAGTGSNGSGTITGGNTRIAMSAGNQALTNQTCVISGDTNRLGFVFCKTLSSCAIAMFIERGKNTDGTDNNLILLCWFDGNKTTGALQSGNQVGTWSTVTNSCGVMTPLIDTRTTGADGFGNIGVYANLFPNAGGFLNAPMGMVGYFNTDITADSTFILTIYGSPHTYYAIGTANPYVNTVTRNSINNNLRMAIRYE